MSVSLLLGLVYLTAELPLTVTRRSLRFFASGASHSDTATAAQLMHRNLLRSELRRVESGLCFGVARPE